MAGRTDRLSAEMDTHLAAIHEIGGRFGLPDEKVRPIYETELRRIGGGARIREFLPLIVSRIVKGVLLGRKSPNGG